jgi:hypothetical protein
MRSRLRSCYWPVSPAQPARKTALALDGKASADDETVTTDGQIKNLF